MDEFEIILKACFLALFVIVIVVGLSWFANAVGITDETPEEWYDRNS